MSKVIKKVKISKEQLELNKQAETAENNRINTFWEMLEKNNHSEVADYYTTKTEQIYKFCNNRWYQYNEFNIIEQLTDRNPPALVSSIAKTLHACYKIEFDIIKKIHSKIDNKTTTKADDLHYDKFDKRFSNYGKSHVKAGTSDYVSGIINFLKNIYVDEKLEDKLDNDINLFAFNNQLYDYKIKAFRQIQKEDYISLIQSMHVLKIQMQKLEKN
jgi:hypothetical protein